MRINKSNPVPSATVLFLLALLLFVFTFGLTLFTQGNYPVGLPGKSHIRLPPFDHEWHNAVLFLLLPFLCAERGLCNIQNASQV